MALVLLKSILFPARKRNGGYAALRKDDEGEAHDNANGQHGGDFSASFADVKASEKVRKADGGSAKPGRLVNARMISDATIGLSDGLTVPFALTAGLSALGDTNVVIYGGLAELIAGGISMGLGGYLGAKSEAEGYAASLAETRRLVLHERERAADMVRETFDDYDFSADALVAITTSLREDPERMIDFLMRFHHQLAEADYAPSKAYVSGLTISAGYVTGGLVALMPYLFLASIHQAFVGSVVVMAIALFVFGWAKTALVGESDRWVCMRNGAQMMVLGGVAAGAAMGCVKAIGD